MCQYRCTIKRILYRYLAVVHSLELPLKILITNTALATYAGTEVVVRDLSLELKRQGHVPMVYSPRLGAVAEEIKSHGIEVSDQLTNLSAPPDIIHGHHHAQVIEALLQFPSIPGVYVCHAAAGLLEDKHA